MAGDILRSSAKELGELLPAIAALAPRLEAVGKALLSSWSKGGKLLTCGNGGSAADAMHFAEELVVRFQKNRHGLAAIALHDPTVLTCAGNDLGYAAVFSRQVEALGRPGDVLAVFTTSGNSENILAAVMAAEKQGLVTVAFLGRDGGKLRSRCTHELLVPATTSHRTQEGHLLLYHALCEWIDTQVD
jgi:D-sedoheptulose 7-phosphate isomerase